MSLCLYVPVPDGDIGLGLDARLTMVPEKEAVLAKVQAVLGSVSTVVESLCCVAGFGANVPTQLLRLLLAIE